MNARLSTQAILTPNNAGMFASRYPRDLEHFHELSDDYTTDTDSNSEDIASKAERDVSGNDRPDERGLNGKLVLGSAHGGRARSEKLGAAPHRQQLEKGKTLARRMTFGGLRSDKAGQVNYYFEENNRNGVGAAIRAVL